jgi:hypothetical protein
MFVTSAFVFSLDDLRFFKPRDTSGCSAAPLLCKVMLIGKTSQFGVLTTETGGCQTDETSTKNANY